MMVVVAPEAEEGDRGRGHLDGGQAQALQGPCFQAIQHPIQSPEGAPSHPGHRVPNLPPSAPMEGMLAALDRPRQSRGHRLKTGQLYQQNLHLCSQWSRYLFHLMSLLPSSERLAPSASHSLSGLDQPPSLVSLLSASRILPIAHLCDRWAHFLFACRAGLSLSPSLRAGAFPSLRAGGAHALGALAPRG